MKHFLAKSSLPLSFVLVILAMPGIFGGLKTEAQTANDSCYFFQPSSDKTVSVELISNSGQKQTITIPNQNPPSILQNIYFYANNNTCALKGYLDRNVVNNYFVTANQLIPVAGNPLLLKRIDSNSSLIGPMVYTHYQGLIDLGMGKSTKAEQIKNEDTVIGSIDKEHKMTLQSSINSQSATMSVPATNCVALSGNGPRKVVFMRGKSMGMTVSDFILYSNQMIADSFKITDPFKTYFDQFSFYVDLKDYDDKSFPDSSADKDGGIGGAGYIFGGSIHDDESILQFNNSMKTNSSCFGVAGANSQYDFSFKFSDMYSAWTGRSSRFQPQGMIFINIDDAELTSKFTSLLFMHETGHSFAGLTDEYIISDIGNIFYSNSDDYENCTVKPLRDFRSSLDNTIYGSVTTDGTIGTKGCSYLKSKYNRSEYYRPNDRSLMAGVLPLQGQTSQDRLFNVISCGYIISAIKGEPIDKAHAETHWPECMNKIDTTQDNIPPPVVAPIVKSVSPMPLLGASGRVATYKVTGSGFTPTDNSIKLMLVKSGSQTPKNSWLAFFSPQTVDAQTQSNMSSYEILEIPSNDGVTLTFTVPNTVPDGTYSISVGAFNSPWTNTSSTIIVSGNGKGDPTTAIGATPTQTTSTNPADRILKYSCPALYALNADNTCYKEGSTVTTPASTVARTVTYSCPTSPAGFENAAYPSGDLMKCVGRYPSPDYVAKATYSCPVGTTLSGTVCNKPAATVITPASYIAPTISYSCTIGYILSSNGVVCSIPKTPILSAVSFGGKINLTWTSDFLPVGSTFEIERMVRNGNFNIMAGVINYNNSYSILARVTGELRSYSDPIYLPVVITDIYSYRIRAKLADGTYTPYSNTITFTIAKDLAIKMGTGATQEIKKLTTPVVTASPVRTTPPSPTPYHSPSNSPSPTPSYSPRTSPMHTSNPVATPYYSPASTQTSSPTPPTVSSNQLRINAITQLYVSLLKRQPDQGGLNYFVNSSMTIDQVRSTLMASQEYKNLTVPTATPSSTNSPSPTPTPTPTSTSSPRPSSSPVSQMNRLNQTGQSFIASVFEIFIKSFLK